MGVLVPAFVTAVGGGMIRDMLIGAVPPVALRDWRDPVAAFAGGALAFPAHPLLGGVPLMLSPALAAIFGGVACFLLRVLAVTFGWRLPTA